MKRAYSCLVLLRVVLSPHRVSTREDGVASPNSSSSVEDRVQISDLLGLDTETEILRLFIKLIVYITDTDITGQIKFPGNIIEH